MRTYIDATIFMGMHSSNEKVRTACKNFFIEHRNKTIFMSLENVGKCDDIVWQYDRKTQDVYYPFMDRLHTIMDIQRIEYTEEDVRNRKYKKDLSLFQQFTVAQASNGRLYTLDKMILSLRLNFVTQPAYSAEKKFPAHLEQWYQKSLKLQIKNIGI